MLIRLKLPVLKINFIQKIKTIITIILLLFLLLLLLLLIRRLIEKNQFFLNAKENNPNRVING